MLCVVSCDACTDVVIHVCYVMYPVMHVLMWSYMYMLCDVPCDDVLMWSYVYYVLYPVMMY